MTPRDDWWQVHARRDDGSVVKAFPTKQKAEDYAEVLRGLGYTVRVLAPHTR